MKEVEPYIDFPERWDELTEEDWADALCIRQKVMEYPGRYTYANILDETARRLLRNRGVHMNLNDRRYLLLVNNLAHSLTWLWVLDADRLSLTWRTTWNRIPSVGKWLGPLSHGEDMAFGEFRQGFTLLRDIDTCSDHTDLGNTALLILAGHLYRPAATPEQSHERQLRRQPWNYDTLEQKAERGRKMKPWQVWGIYAWFAYFCEYLTTGTFIIEGVEVSFAPLFSTSPGEKSGKQTSLQQICLTLAESHVFGTVRDVDDAPLLTVMQKLLMDYDKLQELIKLRKK